MQALKTFFYILRAVALLLLGIFVLVNLYTMYMQIIFNVSYPTLFGLGKYIPSETYQSCNVSENDYLFTIDFGGYKRDDIVILEKTNGSMTIDKVSNNDGGNNLHSDFDLGYHKQLFNAELVDNGVKFKVKTEDGLMGFPGNITASVTYTLSDDNELKLEYEGVSDKATLFNMTNHSYFALGGHEAGSRALLDTVLMINASKATEVRAGLIPTGKICDIKGTAMDFTSPKKIGQDIDSDWEQMKLGNGYDHNFVIDNYDGTLRLVARASYDGRTMEVYSDLPGLQFYSGNGLSPFEAKDGAKYGDRGGFCLETQYFPNSVNEPAFESPVKKAGEKYHTVTIYKFV